MTRDGSNIPTGEMNPADTRDRRRASLLKYATSQSRPGSGGAKSGLLPDVADMVA